MNSRQVALVRNLRLPRKRRAAVPVKGGPAGPSEASRGAGPLVCWVRMLRSEVEVLSRGPDRGNPTSMRQGRGPELTGRLQCGWLRCEAPARAGLKEAIDALWWRTRVKRRKALPGGRAGQRRRCPIPVCRDRERIGDVITAKSQHLTPGDLLGSGDGAGRPENARTMVDGPVEVRGLRSTGRRL